MTDRHPPMHPIAQRAAIVPDDMKRHIAIIGSGGAAFAAAIRAVEAGARVTMIERAPILGGTCVNVGCIPSKIMIRAAEIRHDQAHHRFAGIGQSETPLNHPALLAQIRATVDALRHTKYETILRNTSEITLLRGSARFDGPHRLLVTDEAGTCTKLTPDRILIATGATPMIPSIPGLAGTPFWTSTEALFADALPTSLIVIGSSTIALELAQAYHRLGTAVTVLARTTLLSRNDPALGTALHALFDAEGIRVLDNTQAHAISYQNHQFSVALTTRTDALNLITADHLLIATGREPNTAQLGLDLAGIETNATGAIIVDPQLQTSVNTIYAAGDCSTMPQLVYVPAAACTRAVINMTGGNATLDLAIVPTVIFTDPAVACVGLDEAQAGAAGINVITRRLDLDHVPRALANFDTSGFIKLVAHAESGHLLGAQILARNAGDIIQTAALAIRYRMTVRDLGDMLFPYLTMAEGLKLTAQTFSKNIAQLSCCAG